MGDRIAIISRLNQESVTMSCHNIRSPRKETNMALRTIAACNLSSNHIFTSSTCKFHHREPLLKTSHLRKLRKSTYSSIPSSCELQALPGNEAYVCQPTWHCCFEDLIQFHTIWYFGNHE